jgi:hypothetical protein
MPSDKPITSQDPDIIAIQDEHHERLRRRRRWIIAECAEGYEVHEWSATGVAPPTSYPTKRLAAARVLQLLGIGPVAPQDHPESICVGFVETDNGERHDV